MGFAPRKHYRLGMIKQIVEAVAITTARSASALLQSLGITISHQSVIALKDYAGGKVCKGIFPILKSALLFLRRALLI